MSLVQNVKSGLFSALAATEHFTGGAWRGPLHQAQNFLLLQYPAALGTAIHATPLIPALKHAIPNCRIAVAASGFALDILRHNPGVERLIETPSPIKDFAGAVRGLRGNIPFESGAYVALTSTGNERTLITFEAILGHAATRVGFTVVPQLYRVPLTFDPTRSQIANNLRIVEALGHPVMHFEPEIVFSAEDLQQAKAILHGSGVEDSQPVAVFVTQTSVTQRKGWRPERFRAAATHLHERYGAHILFVGTSAESQAIDELRSSLPFRTTSVAGKTSITGLAALMSLCSVGLTLDTGPLHIGRAANLPMCIIAPAWSPPIEWLPVGDDRYRILKNLDMKSAPADYIIDEVSVEEAIAALDDLLAKYPRRQTT